MVVNTSATVSIPQAVSTIAIIIIDANKNSDVDVSIPQAVSTIAIAGLTKPVFMVA